MTIFILILILLLATLIYLVYVMPLNIFFVFDSDDMNMHLSMTWLKKLNIKAEIIQLKPHISVFLFNKKLFSFIKEKKRGGGTGVLKSLELDNTNVKMFYGFDKPFMTGIIFSVIGFITSLFKIDSFEQYPEFVPANEYLKIEATSKMNIGKTLSNIILLNLKK